jgi:malate dehydrogenase (oxaloacetate-decarboxylating)
MSDGLLDYQRPYARPAEEVAGLTRTPVAADRSAETRWPKMAALQAAAAAGAGIIDLATTVAEVKPTIMIGTSTTPRMFTEAIVKTMAAATERPIVFPLSNPTELHEATPEQLLTWTDGKALVATGAPFDDVQHGGVTYRIGQANNAALYPGFGFGVIVSRPSKVTDEMILAAAEAVAGEADLSTPGASLLPSNAALRTTSSIVAVEVARTALEQGLAGARLDDPVEVVREAAWWPVYSAVEAI